MKNKQNIFQLIICVSILFFSLSIVEAVEPFKNLPDDMVLVEVLGQKVFLKDIEPDLEIKKKHQESDANDQFNLWLKHTRASNLGRYFKPLLDDYAKEKGLNVTEAEIRERNERMRTLMVSENQRWKEKRNNLAKELIAENIEHGKRVELEKNLDVCSRVLASARDPNQMFRNNDITKSVILSWKLNKELYNQYKGRVIFQQAGPEPLDAYRQFFEQQQSKGKFKFFNKDAEDLFWDYYKNVRHTVIKDPNEADQMINIPWWLKEKEEDYYDTEADWGQDVDGLQIRIRTAARSRVFVSDKIPIFKLELLNTGDKTFGCAALEQFCELEVDGKWYRWHGPQAVDILSVVSAPKSVQYDFLEIKLDETWGLKKPLSQEDKNSKIHLTLGPHILRVKYSTIDTRCHPALEVISNSLKVKIIAPKR